MPLQAKHTNIMDENESSSNPYEITKVFTTVIASVRTGGTKAKKNIRVGNNRDGISKAGGEEERMMTVDDMLRYWLQHPQRGGRCGVRPQCVGNTIPFAPQR